MSELKCDICLSKLDGKEFTRSELDYNNGMTICPRCGTFEYSQRTIKRISNMCDQREELRWILSYWIRNRKEKIVILTRDLVLKIREDISLPDNPEDQLESFILWLGESLKGKGLDSQIEENPSNLASVIGAKNQVDVKYITDELVKRELIKIRTARDGLLNLSQDTPPLLRTYFGFKFDGWSKFRELQKSRNSGNIAFMAMKYSDSEHNQIDKTHFKKAVRQTGFKLIRLDEILEAGLIDNQLRVEIQKGRFILADLTEKNLGAYWEAGYAEGLGKPVIYLCEKQHFRRFKTHFDTNHHTTIQWEIDNINKAMKDLKATIRRTLPLEAKMEDD